jgi:peptidoglycan/xylan/chitin deacetylase (PgdA/CDA1 family)/PKD repeat protein
MRFVKSGHLPHKYLILALFLGAFPLYFTSAAAQAPNPATPVPMGMVSINFDDGKISGFQNAIPILDAAGLKSTQYIITGFLGTPGYIGVPDLLSMQADGHEIGAHSRTHGDLRIPSLDRLATETAGSRQDLIALGMSPSEPFAYPSGYSNTTVAQAVSNNGFFMGRVAGGGLNVPATTDLFNVKCVDVTNTLSLGDVEYWITKAKDQKQWLILLFHDVDNTGSTYSTPPQMFRDIVDYLVAEKVPVVTMSQALANMRQLKGIKIQPPSSSISTPNADPVITVGDSVTFQGAVTQPVTTALTYHWSFGANSGIADSTIVNPNAVQFMNPGVFTVTFTATDTAGLSSTSTRIVTVLPSTPSVIPNHNWKVVYVDSQQVTYEGAKAIDGTDRPWATESSPVSSPLPHEIQLDLGAVYDLTGFQYLPRQDSSWGRVGQFAFYVSTDGVGWKNPVASGTFSTNDSLLKTVAFKKNLARFVRFVALSSVSNALVEVTEIKVIGTLADAAPMATIVYPITDLTIRTGDSVTFLGTATVQNANSTPLSWAWSFSSKYTSIVSSVQNPGAIKFATPGKYRVQLNVTDALGRISKVEKRTIDVQ